MRLILDVLRYVSGGNDYPTAVTILIVSLVICGNFSLHLTINPHSSVPTAFLAFHPYYRNVHVMSVLCLFLLCYTIQYCYNLAGAMTQLRPWQWENSWYGPFAKYVKLCVAHVPGMPETFSPPPRVSDPDMHHHSTCVTHVPWCTPGSVTSGLLWNWWRGKHSRHSRGMRNPQFNVSGKRPIMGAVSSLVDYVAQDIVKRLYESTENI